MSHLSSFKVTQNIQGQFFIFKATKRAWLIHPKNNSTSQRAK